TRGNLYLYDAPVCFLHQRVIMQLTQRSSRSVLTDPHPGANQITPRLKTPARSVASSAKQVRGFRLWNRFVDPGAGTVSQRSISRWLKTPLDQQPTAVLVIVFTLVTFMSVLGYESLKAAFVPDLKGWPAHWTSILFVSGLAALVSSVGLRRRDRYVGIID